MGRKRQRSRVALIDDDEQPIATLDESDSAQDHEGSKSQADDDEAEKRKKELDVWDAFKEEHHEGLFPMHRRVHTPTSLMFNSARTAAVVVAPPVQTDARIGLSERGCASESSLWASVSLTFSARTVLQTALLASVRRYISLRESLAARNVQDNSWHADGAQSNATGVNNLNVNQGGDTSPIAMQVDSTESSRGKATIGDNVRAASTNASPPAAYQPKSGETTRTLLQHIAQTAEETIRTAEEKVSIAQTAYETVRESFSLSRLCIAHPCMQ